MVSTIFCGILYELFVVVSYDSPQNFTSIPGLNSVLFSWMEPSSTNGIIINYNLTVTSNLDESKLITFIIEVNPSQRIINKIVDGFSPYQNYTASVSASTIIGAGPVASTAGRTLPDSKYIIMIHLLKYNTQFRVHLIW